MPSRIEPTSQVGSIYHTGPVSWRAMGDAHYVERRYQEALLAYNQAVHLDRNDAKAFHGLALAKFRLNDLEGGLADLDRAVQLNPEDADALISRGSFSQIQGRYDEAINFFDAAIPYATNPAVAISCRGDAKLARHDYKGSNC